MTAIWADLLPDFQHHLHPQHMQEEQQECILAIATLNQHPNSNLKYACQEIEQVFTKWCNMHLVKKNDESLKITYIEDDLRDGVRLLALLEVLSGERLPKAEGVLNQTSGGNTSGGHGFGMMRIHKIVNVHKALEFLTKKLNEPLANIGAEDIVDGNLKLTMGLVWVIISFWSIAPTPDDAQLIIAPFATTEPQSFHSDATNNNNTNNTLTPPDSPKRLSNRISIVSSKFTDFAQQQQNQQHPPLPHSERHEPRTMSSDGRSKSLPVVLSNRSPKASLLAWCHQIMAPYAEIGILPVVTDFTRAWQNGVAFLVLVHTFKPDLVPDLTELYTRLDSRKKKALGIKVPHQPTVHVSNNNNFTNQTFQMTRYLYTTSRKEWHSTLERAFKLAEEFMGVSRLLDPEDLTEVEEPEERTVMTYVSELRNVLRGRLPFALPQPPLSSEPQQTQDSSTPTISELPSLITQYLDTSKKLTTWIQTQQRILTRLSSCLISGDSSSSTLTVTSLVSILDELSISGSWIRRIVELVLDRSVCAVDFGNLVDGEVGRARRGLEGLMLLGVGNSVTSPLGSGGSLSVNNARNSSGSGGDSVKVEGVMLSDSEAVGVRVSLERLFERIVKVREVYHVELGIDGGRKNRRNRDVERHPEGGVSLLEGVEEVVKVHEGVVETVREYVEGVVSGVLERLKGYGRFVVDFEDVLNLVTDEVNGDSPDSLKSCLQGAQEMISLLTAELSLATSSKAFTSKPKIRAVSEKLQRILTESVGRDKVLLYDVDKGDLDDEEDLENNSIVTLAERVDANDLPKVMNIEIRAEELIRWLNVEVVDRRGAGDAVNGTAVEDNSMSSSMVSSVSSLSSSISSFTARVAEGQYRLVPAFICSRGSEIVVRIQNDILDPLRRDVKPAVEEIASQIRDAAARRVKEIMEMRGDAKEGGVGVEVDEGLVREYGRRLKEAE
ncbi:actinin alpha 2, partial [Blyttiomyces sp. JEL0837]